MPLANINPNHYTQQLPPYLTVFAGNMKYKLNGCFKGRKSEKNLDSSLYPDQHQKLIGSFLGRDPSSVQVSWKSVQHFLCNPAYKNQLTNKETDKRTWVKEFISLHINSYQTKWVMNRLNKLANNIIVRNALTKDLTCPL